MKLTDQVQESEMFFAVRYNATGNRRINVKAQIHASAIKPCKRHNNNREKYEQNWGFDLKSRWKKLKNIH